MKKILVFVLAFSVLISSTCMVGIAENAEVLDPEGVETQLIDENADNYIDLDLPAEPEKEVEIIEEKPYIEKEEYKASYVEVLAGLGILNDEKDYERIITRGEFAHYLCMLSNYNTDIQYSDIKFADTENSLYANEISFVDENGWMIGYGEDVFKPDKDILIIEAATAILKMAGYRSIAESKGGYPQGYADFASATGLFDNIPVGNVLTYENLVKLIYNALFVPIMDFNGTSYITNGEKNLLSRLFDAECKKGQITATEFASIGERNAAFEDCVTVTIDGIDHTLMTSGIRTDDLLGLYAYFYIVDNEKLLAFEPINNKFSAVKISRSGIVSIDKALTVLEAVYDSKSKVKKYKIASDAEFIYNGKSCFEVTKEEIENVNGNLRLVDYNNDGEYDIVYIWNYQTYFVNSTNAAEKIINDKKPGKFLKLDEDKSDIKYYKYGKSAEFSNIMENDVVSVGISKPISGDTLITVHISSTSITGNLKQISDTEIMIDENTYIMSKDFDLSGINIGTRALFGVNFMGEVCCYNKIYTTEKEYAYLINAFESEDDNGEYCCVLKFMAESGNVETAFLTEKFSLNNERSSVESVLAELTDNGEIKGQLIAFNRNTEGKITRLYTSGEETPVAEDTAYEKLTFNKKYQNVRFRIQNIQGEYITDADTKIFLVVLDGNSNLMVSSSGVYDQLTNPVGDGYRPTTYVYDAGTDLVAGAILFEIPQSSFSSMLGGVSTYSFLVDNFATVVDENNDIVTKVTGYLFGSEAEYILDDSLDVSEWQRGDVRMISVSNKSNKIIASRQFFGVSNKTGLAPMNILYRDTDYSTYPAYYNIMDATDNTSQESTQYGIIESVSHDPEYVIIELADGSGKRVGRMTAYSKFYKCDIKNHISSITSADIIPGMSVYMMTRYGNILELVMFED